VLNGRYGRTSRTARRTARFPRIGNRVADARVSLQRIIAAGRMRTGRWAKKTGLAKSVSAETPAAKPKRQRQEEAAPKKKVAAKKKTGS